MNPAQEVIIVCTSVLSTIVEIDANIRQAKQ